ncbi:hypothetical protein C9374_010763 [Naegleria lovaniensis]|uniref:Uncharacterized protein n=1 Tax=Naegleria lovaniensis TaxID=51637 RepID=A0AA88KFE7_NAELO|nr:uncharacterized protein C9374_010763 [Naegleria lovaniensis]KAG2374479.1 hypothetical protein C9374_010763 [Naegleria lovaniensis]
MKPFFEDDSHTSQEHNHHNKLRNDHDYSGFIWEERQLMNWLKDVWNEHEKLSSSPGEDESDPNHTLPSSTNNFESIRGGRKIIMNKRSVQNQQLISEWNRQVAKFNLLFPCSESAIHEQQVCLNMLKRMYYEKSHLKSNTCNIDFLSNCFNNLFVPLRYMRLDSTCCCKDYFSAETYPQIRTFDFPTFLNYEMEYNSDSLLGFFGSAQLLGDVLDTIFDEWETLETSKKSYGPYSWAPLSRKINVLMTQGEYNESIPEPPSVENSSCVMREPVWRVFRDERGEICCILSNDFRLMEIEYFCLLLTKYLPYDKLHIQQLLLTSSVHRRNLYGEWEERISNMSTVQPESTWLSYMITLCEYLFPNSKIDIILRRSLTLLDGLRAKVFKQNHHEEFTMCIVQITPELISNTLSSEEILLAITAVENLNRFFERQNFNGHPMNVLNWITCGLLKDLHLVENCTLLGSKQKAMIFQHVSEKIDKFRKDNIPFRFSPTFFLIYLASQAASENVQRDEPLVLNNVLHQPSSLDFRDFSPLSSTFENLLTLVNCGDSFLFGALLEHTLGPTIYSAQLNQIEEFHHLNIMLQDHVEIKKQIEREVAIHYSSDIRELMIENSSRGEDFHFLCTLLICSTKQLLHNRKDLTRPTFQKAFPALYSPTLMESFANLRQPHPVLLNTHCTSTHRRYVTLLVDSKTDYTSLLSMSDEVINHATQEDESSMMTLELMIDMLIERLISISIPISNKIELVFFVLKYGFKAPTHPCGLLMIEKCTPTIQSLLKIVFEQIQAKGLK